LFFQTEILGEYSEAYERYHSQLLRLEEIEKADLDSYIQCLIINGN
jgi:hypothetical protein